MCQPIPGLPACLLVFVLATHSHDLRTPPMMGLFYRQDIGALNQDDTQKMSSVLNAHDVFCSFQHHPRPPVFSSPMMPPHHPTEHMRPRPEFPLFVITSLILAFLDTERLQGDLHVVNFCLLSVCHGESRL